MNRRIILLNAALLFILVRGWMTLRGNWLEYESRHQPSFIEANVETTSAAAAGSGRAALASQDWMEVSSKDPFSFDRNDITVVAKLEEKAAPDAGPKPILFGTAFLGKDPMAMIGSGRTPSRSFRPMKVGETIDGWAITKIDEKTVVVEVGERREVLIMNDPTVAIPRDVSKTLVSAPNVPSGVSAQASPSTPPPAAPSAPATGTPSASPNGYTPGTVVKTPFGNIVVQ